MASAGEGNCIVIVDAWTFQVTHTLGTGNVSNLTSLMFSTDGNYLGFIGKKTESNGSCFKAFLYDLSLNEVKEFRDGKDI